MKIKISANMSSLILIKKMRVFFLFYLSTVFLFSACNTDQAEDLGLSQNFADFQAFYHDFHRDSLFQLAHISFPLQGIPDNVANKPEYNEGFRWSAETWPINKPIDLASTKFSRELIPMGDRMIIERLSHESGRYGMERRFAKTGEEWMLIYYQGINPL